MEEDYRQAREKLDSKLDGLRVSRKGLAVAGVAFLVLVVGFGVMQMDLELSVLESTNSTDSSEEEQVQQTKYQRVYVDCPPEHLDFCTKLSKIPTEEVHFDRVEDGRIYLDTEDGRTMVGRLPEGNSSGYLIRIN